MQADPRLGVLGGRSVRWQVRAGLPPSRAPGAAWRRRRCAVSMALGPWIGDGGRCRGRPRRPIRCRAAVRRSRSRRRRSRWRGSRRRTAWCARQAGPWSGTPSRSGRRAWRRPARSRPRAWMQPRVRAGEVCGRVGRVALSAEPQLFDVGMTPGAVWQKAQPRADAEWMTRRSEESWQPEPEEAQPCVEVAVCMEE